MLLHARLAVTKGGPRSYPWHLTRGHRCSKKLPCNTMTPPMESAANHVRLSSNKRNLNGIWEGTASPIGTHTLAVVDLGQFTASDSVRTIVSFSCVRDGVTFFCCCISCDPIVTFERRVDPSDNYPYFPNFSSVNGSFRSQHARLLHWISLSRYVRSRLRIIMPRRQIICNRIIPN